MMLNIVYAIFTPFFWTGYLYQQMYQSFFDGRVRSQQHLVKLMQKAGKLPVAEKPAIMFTDLADTVAPPKGEMN